VNGSIDAAPTKKRRIRRIDYGTDVQLSNVCAYSP
jgi:hypothetical protein